MLGVFERGYKFFSAVKGEVCYDEMSDYQVRAHFSSGEDKLHYPNSCPHHLQYPNSKLSTPVALPTQ